MSGLSAAGHWADLGSGAGFPGVALAEAYPEASVVLVESREKRAQFLKRLVIEVGLDNLSVYHGRSENLAPGFDGLISRAYRPPDKVLADADRLLKEGGHVVILSGDDLPAVSGWQVISSERYRVVDGDRVRTVLSRDLT